MKLGLTSVINAFLTICYNGRSMKPALTCNAEECAAGLIRKNERHKPARKEKKSNIES